MTPHQNYTRNKQYSREQRHGLADAQKEAKVNLPRLNISIAPWHILSAEDLEEKTAVPSETNAVPPFTGPCAQVISWVFDEQDTDFAHRPYTRDCNG